VSATWVVVIGVGATTIAIKALGPMLVAGRDLPTRVNRAVECLAPALLAALVVTQAVGDRGGLSVDERLLGVAAALVALRLRASTLFVVMTAAAVTAFARLIQAPMLAMIVLLATVIVFDLAGALGANSGDGNDWVEHPPKGRDHEQDDHGGSGGFPRRVYRRRQGLRGAALRLARYR
jgi:branched chain amino acid efflux pump